MKNGIAPACETYRQALIDLVCDLVNIPTENHPPCGDEAAGQDYMERYFRSMGLEVDVFSPLEVQWGHAAYLSERSMEGRNNVVGVLRGSGGGKTLILSGHMDVAPKEPLPWTVCEPFESVVKGGRIYGRGSSDMKGGLASAVMAVKILKESGYVPRGDIILESVVDEEYASGNGTIAACLRGYKGGLAIIPEPSGLNVCAANVGGVMYRIRIQGEAGMPYTGKKAFNISYALADMLKLIEKHEEDREDSACPAIWDDAVQKRKIVVTKVKAGEVQEHGQLGAPIDAWIEISVQTYPDEEMDAVTAELEEMIRKGFPHCAGVEVTPLYHYVEPGNTDPKHEGVALLNESLNSAMGGGKEVTIAPFPCDLFVFEKYAGTPAVVFGPEGGNLHAPNEWVDIESMMKVMETLVDFIPKWCD